MKDIWPFIALFIIAVLLRILHSWDIEEQDNDDGPPDDLMFV